MNARALPSRVVEWRNVFRLRMRDFYAILTFKQRVVAGEALSEGQRIISRNEREPRDEQVIRKTRLDRAHVCNELRADVRACGCLFGMQSRVSCVQQLQEIQTFVRAPGLYLKVCRRLSKVRIDGLKDGQEILVYMEWIAALPVRPNDDVCFPECVRERPKKLAITEHEMDGRAVRSVCAGFENRAQVRFQRTHVLVFYTLGVH